MDWDVRENVAEICNLVGNELIRWKVLSANAAARSGGKEPFRTVEPLQGFSEERKFESIHT